MTAMRSFPVKAVESKRGATPHASALPQKPTHDGLPIGVQLIDRRWGDAPGVPIPEIYEEL
ncbi:MAG: hypothetical protein EXR27_15500 [Betaproteobacteria bacterium]|nr:hypothetical protein [Betaproteobacteria bacterium]